MAANIDGVIDGARAGHLNAMLQALNSDSALKGRIHHGLGILSDYDSRNDDESTNSSEEGDKEEEEDDDDDEPLTTSSTLKRKREVASGSDSLPVLDICNRPSCRRPFIPGDDDEDGSNSEEACQFHPGELQLDESADSWEGWIYEHDGAMDSAASREINPTGFRYACCDEDGESDGCTWDRHSLTSPPKDSSGTKKQRRG